jgi:hypothetical protein
MIKPFYNRFDEIDHLPLRTFNRCVLTLNIENDFGIEDVKTYLDMFSHQEKLQMNIMMHFIKNFGVDAARNAATKDATFEYDAGDPDYQPEEQDSEVEPV